MDARTLVTISLAVAALAVGGCGDDNGAALDTATGATTSTSGSATPTSPATGTATTSRSTATTPSTPPTGTGDGQPGSVTAPPTVTEVPAGTRVSANNAPLSAITAALRAAGVDDPGRWAQTVAENRPYDPTEPGFARLRGALAKAGAPAAEIERIVGVLVP